jgi:hypothetical protein
VNESNYDDEVMKLANSIRFDDFTTDEAAVKIVQFALHYSDTLRKEHNELLEALKRFLNLKMFAVPCADCDHDHCKAVRSARSAIASAEKRKGCEI